MVNCYKYMRSLDLKAIGHKQGDVGINCMKKAIATKKAIAAEKGNLKTQRRTQ